MTLYWHLLIIYINNTTKWKYVLIKKILDRWVKMFQIEKKKTFVEIYRSASVFDLPKYFINNELVKWFVQLRKHNTNINIIFLNCTLIIFYNT